MKATTPAAYKLFHEGSLALAQVEASGMRIDVDYLAKAMEDVRGKASRLESELKEDKVYRTWRKRYGDKTKLGSLEQLAEVFFNVMELGEPEYTAGSYNPDGSLKPKPRIKADEKAFECIDHPFIKKYIRAKKFRNAESTFLGGIANNVEKDGLLHASFNLHTVVTTRSSCDNPNTQNWPVRIDELAKLIRECFIPRGEDYLIGEIDFKGVEVGVAACYNFDPELINYVKNSPPLDMHRDMAMACYKLPKELVSDTARYCAKNMFVFPEFYGSYFKDCSRNLWEATARLKLATEGTEIPLRKWLAKHGIQEPGAFNGKPEPGTFEHHVKRVEEKFWNKFSVYSEWKEDWVRKYNKRGWYELYTGFVVSGIFKRNEIINGAIQGTAFHCNLLTLIEFQKWLTKYKMKTRIIGEIHDSQIIDFHKKEVEDCLAFVDYFVTRKLPKIWPWIIVPMSIEAAIAPEGKSWYHKAKIKQITAPAGKSRLSWDTKAEQWCWR